MNISLIPRAGLRFSLSGCEFEVTYAEYGSVRYAAVAGGKSHMVTAERFLELIQNSSTKNYKSVDGPGANPAFVGLDPEQRRMSLRQMRYVQAVTTMLGAPQSQKKLQGLIPLLAAQFEDPKPPGTRTVATWVRNYYREGKSATGCRSRASDRGNRTIRFSVEVEALLHEAIEKVYLCSERRQGQDVLAFIVGNLAERGLLNAHTSVVKVPSLRTIQRRLKKLDPYVVTLARQGKVAADKIARAAGKQILSHNPLFLVQIDTHTLDILVTNELTGEAGARPYLVLIIDVCTRAVLGFHISLLPPSATTTLAAMKEMLRRPNMGLPGGIPVKIIPDNGVEFKNTAVAYLCHALGIVICPAEIRDPNDKPHVERIFGSITRGIIQKIPGTTFSNPKERGDYDSAKYSSITLEDLRGYIREWIDEVYHITIHSETGRAPALAWKDQIENWDQSLFSEEELDAMARWPYERTIHRGRVQVDGLEYYSHALATLESTYQGKVTVLVNELDLGHVIVKHPEFPENYIRADSTDPDYASGLTHWEHQEAKKVKSELSTSDLNRLGRYANLIAHHKLMSRVYLDSLDAKRRKQKMKRGLSAKIASLLSDKAAKPPVQIESLLAEVPAVPWLQVTPYQHRPHALDEEQTWGGLMVLPGECQ